jgi:hypothetical protein
MAEASMKFLWDGQWIDFTSPRRGEVEAVAPAKYSGEGSLHARGLAERPLTRRASAMRVDLSPAARGELSILPVRLKAIMP